MINLDVLEKDINVKILANLSIRDMSHVFRVNKNLLNRQEAILPFLQKEIEVRVNTLVQSLIVQWEKDKQFDEIARIKNIHPCQWGSEFDVYFTDDLKYSLKKSPPSLEGIKFHADNWILNKIYIKIPSSSENLIGQLLRLYREIIDKDPLEISEVAEKEDPMQVDEVDASSSCSSPSSSSQSEVIVLRTAAQRLSRQDYIRIFCKWISAASREEKNDHFSRVWDEIAHSYLPVSALMDYLREAANRISQAGQIDKYIGAFFQSLLAYGQLEMINTHLYSQNKNAVCEFFSQSLQIYPEQLKLLLINYPAVNKEVKDLQKCGFILLMKSYIRNKQDTRALDLAKYNMHNTLCQYIINLFNFTDRSKMERLEFCCQLLLRYPQVLKNKNNVHIIKKCASEAILVYGLRSVEEAVPQQLRGQFVKFSQAELMQLQHSYETNRQKLFFQLLGE